MKRILALTLAISALLTHAYGCNGGSGIHQGNSAHTSDARQTASAQTSAPLSKTPEIQTEEPTPQPTEPPFWQPGEVCLLAKARFSNIKLDKQVKLDYFALPDAVFELLTPGDIELYGKIVTAFFAGEDHVELSENIGEYPNIVRLIDMYFPVFFHVVDDKSFTINDNKLNWKEKNPSLDRSKAINEFENAVLELLSDVNDDNSFIINALSVYKKLTASTEYSEKTDAAAQALYEPSSPFRLPVDEGHIYLKRHCADALVEKQGVCWSFARAYCFLLCQIGAEAFCVHGLRQDDGAKHEWTVFKYKDLWRYADPTWDIGGDTLFYFGFTAQSRGFDGYPEENVCVLEGNAHRVSKLFDISDQFFAPVTTGNICAQSYCIDTENQIIVFGYLDDDNNVSSEMYFDPETGNGGEMVNGEDDDNR